MTVYGRNSIWEAIDEGLTISKVYIQNGKKEKFEKIMKQLRDRNIPINFIGEKQLDGIARSRKHQGISAVLKLPPNIVESEKDHTEPDWKTFSRIVALDGITNTGNLGAIIRSALLLGTDAIVLPNDNSARITPEVIRASAGALYKETVVYINNLNRFLSARLEEDFEIWGLAEEGQKKIDDLTPPEKLVLVIGNERDGLRKATRKICTHLVSIPTTRKIDSLNASVAAAIAMWECKNL